ncbi:MAG: hypothetical protein U9N34_08730, partial [Candidatus Cloacimonadota bacterium]|nr:hypothetical protein [Candidatus Cloacimonadota bacterium]
NNTDENEIVKIITPHDTLFTTSEKNNITHFQIDISQLEKTLNAINVNIGETYSKELLLKKIPPQKNEIKIDKLTGAMIKSQKPFIPFGFYCYFPVQETLLEQEAVNGFNMVSPYQNVAKDDFKDRLSYMDRAAELDMVVNYNLLSVSGGGGVNSFIFEDTSQSELEKKLIEEINKIKHHPALLSWYISDEPVANHKSPQELEAIYDIIKREDPYHPISIVFWHSKKSKKYAKAMDIAMADPYPIPKQSMRKVAGVTQMLKSNFEFDKPIWMVPQSFGGNEWWDREPTSQELRLMTYFSILNGATGIKYFVRNGANGFPKSVKTWNEAGEIALEISEITPYLLSENKIIVDN